MIEIVWEFRVRAGREQEFEAVYGPRGDWSVLFRRAEGYAGTRLLRDLEDRGRFLTTDRWESRDAVEKFKERFVREYAEMDAKCEALTESERLLGVFEPLGE